MEEKIAKKGAKIGGNVSKHHTGDGDGDSVPCRTDSRAFDSIAGEYRSRMWIGVDERMGTKTGIAGIYGGTKSQVSANIRDSILKMRNGGKD